jgi:hypothetical protein
MEIQERMKGRMKGCGRGTVSGYFDNVDVMAQSAAAMSGMAEGVYVTLNAVRGDLFARSANHLRDFALHTTRDAEVIHRRWLLID